MKKIFVILGIFIVLFLVVTYLSIKEVRRQRTLNEHQKEKIINEKDNQETTRTVTTSGTYTNEECGFQIELPNRFKEYSLEIYRADDPNEFPGFDIVEFWLPGYNGDTDYLLFAIVCCPTSKMPEIREKCSDEFQSIHFNSAYNCQPIEDSIGQNDKNVFSIMGPHEDPEELFSQLESEIIKNFKPIQ